jgi:glycosyltransferase involved in cell wall biosynthesis
MRISVYITSFNQKEFLIEAVESVLAQTLPASQIIIADDYSQDGSQEVIAGFQSRYPELITPIYHERNLGVARTRADALQSVVGDYVTYVDGDDRYLPTKLEREAALLERHAEAQLIYSNNYYMTSDGHRTGTWVTTKRPPEGYVFRETFARDFPRGQLFRMELVPYQAWRQVGFHDVNLRLLEDWDMRIRLSKHYRIAYCDEPLTEVRQHNTGLSSLGASERLAALDHIWEKNKELLDDVDADDRAYIAGTIGRLRAEFMRRQAKEELGAFRQPRGSIRHAIKYYRESLQYELFFDLDVLAGLVLPQNLYRWLRTRARRVRDKLDVR